MGDVGGGRFLEGRESDRIEDGSDRFGGRRLWQPKPPPRAPWELRTCPENPSQEPWKSADPASGSGTHLGDADRKGKDSEGKSDPDGKDPRGKGIPKEKIPKLEDSEGEDSKGKDRKGKIDTDNDEEMEEETSESNRKRNGACAHYHSKTTRGMHWVPMSKWEERQYRDYFNSRGDWQYQDGAWRETRNPTDAAIDVVDGSEKAVGFGEHAGDAYGEVLTNKPQYSGYPMTEEDRRNRSGAKKSTKRAKRHQSDKA